MKCKFNTPCESCQYTGPHAAPHSIPLTFQFLKFCFWDVDSLENAMVHEGLQARLKVCKVVVGEILEDIVELSVKFLKWFKAGGLWICV